MQQFWIEGIACPTHAEALRRAVSALDPETRVDIDPESGAVLVRSTISTALINGAILNAGFCVIHKPAGPR